MILFLSINAQTQKILFENVYKQSNHCITISRK